MFASPNPQKNSIGKDKSDECHNITSREKVSKLLMTRYIKSQELNKDDIRIAQEIQKFVNQKGVTEKDLKELDIKMEKIIREIKSKSYKPQSEKIILKTDDVDLKNNKGKEGINNNLNNINQEKVNNELGPLLEDAKLPFVQFKSLSINGLITKPESRSSQKTKMSGASKLSNFNDRDIQTNKINQLLKNFPKEYHTARVTQENLPYDINDFDSIVKYDTMLYKEEMKKKRQTKLNMQILMRKDLNEQIEEKEAKLVEEKRINLEYDEFINNHNKLLDKIDREKKNNYKNQYREDLDNILKHEVSKKLENFKKEQKLEREYVKRFLNQLNKEKQQKLNKKKFDLEFFENVKKNEELRKENERLKLQHDRENEIKWNEEMNLILDKQDKIRFNKYHVHSIEEPIKSSNLMQKSLDTEEQSNNDNNNLAKSVSIKPVYIKDEESILKQMLFENMKKYNKLEEKIKEIEEKIELARQKDKNLNKFSNSMINEKVNFHSNNNEISLKKTQRDDFKIIRPSNSFIGKKVPSISNNYNSSMKKLKQVIKPQSELRGLENKSVSNIIVNSNKYNNQKNSSMLFTTQLN